MNGLMLSSFMVSEFGGRKILRVKNFKMKGCEVDFGLLVQTFDP